MTAIFEWTNILILTLLILWTFAVIVIYRNSRPKELNRTGLHFEFAAIAFLFLIYVNYSWQDLIIGEGLLVIAPIVIGRFFVASEIIHKKRS
tara:strand:+ start:291 stop:566 length:276 start_codon:yes stop_codon:yes gene_type:complete